MPKPDVSEMRSKQIIEAAISVFSEKGFHQARMEDISAAASLSKGTLYLYFKDKDALIKAIADKVFHQELAELEIARQLPGTTAEKLQSLVEFVAAEEEETAILLPIVYEFYALSVRRADVRQIVSEHLCISVEFIKEILKQGVEKGELPPVDTEKAAMTFMTLLEGTIGQEFYSSDAVDTGEQLRFGVNLLLKGLAADGR